MPALRAVDRLVVLRLAVLRLAVVRFLAVPRLAVDRFFAVPRFAVVRLAVVRFFAVLRLAAVLFFVPDFLALDFFALAFLAEDLRVEAERDPEREELREPERDEERVDAAMAAGAISALSMLDASPMAESPQVTSAVGSSDDSLHEPADDVSDVSPVPLQSSWVINDLLSRIARARFPTTFVCNVQRGRTSSCRTLLQR